MFLSYAREMEMLVKTVLEAVRSVVPAVCLI